MDIREKPFGLASDDLESNIAYQQKKARRLFYSYDRLLLNCDVMCRSFSKNSNELFEVREIH